MAYSTIRVSRHMHLLQNRLSALARSNFRSRLFVEHQHGEFGASKLQQKMSPRQRSAAFSSMATEQQGARVIDPPPQNQVQPGTEGMMDPKPEVIRPDYRGSGKLKGKVALITGADSGIGRAVAVHFAREGADVHVAYLNEHEDAEATKKMVEQEGAKCITTAGDVGDVAFCGKMVENTVKQMGRLDILVNNAGEQHTKGDIGDLSPEQIVQTFKTNIFSMFYLCKAAVPHLQPGSAIINTSSVTHYKGKQVLLDYSATKGAIVAFTRSLSQQLVEKHIRVNAVAPGPIWTPLIPATFSEEKVDSFGQEVPMKRPGQPSEVAPAYVFLASEDASYFTGQTLHPNGGVMVNG